MPNHTTFTSSFTGLGAVASVSGGRVAGRADKTAGKLAGQPKKAVSFWSLAPLSGGSF